MVSLLEMTIMCHGIGKEEEMSEVGRGKGEAAFLFCYFTGTGNTEISVPMGFGNNRCHLNRRLSLSLFSVRVQQL